MLAAGLRGPVRSIGTLSDDALASAYAGAVCLIVTSTHEGFCLPVLEAQNLRIPVITSDIPILREVAGEGALYFDLQDPATLAHCLLRMFCDPDLRRRMALASQRNALRFHGRAQLPKPKPFSRSC
jgi:glycosyltransferase involved in cell wall biosynthesis